MGSFPCGQLYQFPCGKPKDKFYRKYIPTKVNPVLDNIIIKYNDHPVDFEFCSNYQLLLEVYLKILTPYKTPTEVSITIPRNINIIDPFILKYIFYNDKNEKTFKINKQTMRTYFNDSEEQYICWSGDEINEILRDEENKCTKRFMKNFCVNNELESIDHQEFYQYILKNKLEKIQYVKLQGVKINVTPDNGNNILIRFGFVNYKKQDLDDVLAVTNVCITNYEN